MEHKIRWYLESSFAIIYWSIAFIAFFFSLIFILEKAEVHWKSFLFLFLFLVMIYLSKKRWLIFNENGVKVTYAQFWKNKFYPYETIEKILVSENTIQITLLEKSLSYHIKKKEAATIYQKVHAKLPNILLKVQ